jgi:hypothetical protein
MWHLRIVGTILSVAGTLMVITGVRLAFTKYDFSSTQDVSTWVGSTGVSLLIAVLGVYLLKRSVARPKVAKEPEGNADADDKPSRSGLLVPFIIIFGVGGAYGLLQIADVAVEHLAVRGKVVSGEGKAGVARTFRGDGVTFSLPEGWTSVPLQRTKTMARLISPGSTPRQLKAMIMVDTGRPTIPDAKGTAASLAKQWGATVLEQQTELDGVPAVRVRGKNPGPGVKPVEAIVAIRKGRVYMIMGGVAPGESCEEAVEHVRKSWKWVD